MAILGVDIGGTSCTVVRASDEGVPIARRDLATGDPGATLDALLAGARELEPGPDPVIGIACGGPLDVAAGLVCSPPNLPGWDRVPVVDRFESEFGGRGFLMNDASAGALAEWRFGAGRGLRHLAFLTFGTGIGAGLILDGRLYEGAGGQAGEIGHLRLTDDGPVGHGKSGSVEGWCSGGGLRRRLAAACADGTLVGDDPSPEHWAERARDGDPAAREIFTLLGRHLGRTVAILVDLLALEAVVLGSLYLRCRDLFEEAFRDEFAAEALPASLAGCRVVASELGEDLGAYQSIAVAVARAGGLLPPLEDPRVAAGEQL